MKKVGEVLARQGRGRPQPPSGAAEAPKAAEDDVCPVCRGAGWLRANVPYGHPSFGRLFPCECRLAEMDARRSAQLKEYSALDAFRGCTFEGFDPRVPGTERAYKAAREFAKDPTKWLLLIGSYGCGKTHLAAAIANQAIAQGNPVLFEVVPDLLDHLRSAFSPNSDVAYDELFERVRTAGLLVLDDLGTENTTPWAREKLYQIINYRYNYRQPTVITTNRRLMDIDERIRSRMTDADLCIQIEIKADDYRQRQPGQRMRQGRGRA